ncbi:MAG: hypothetical protein U0Z26_13550 [Anaerolineales bacterium]
MKRAEPLLIFIAVVIAFVLRHVIYEVVILPFVTYLWWLLGLYYHLLPQLVI